jgi:sec-independent protein translocase protein TatC
MYSAVALVLATAGAFVFRDPLIAFLLEPGFRQVEFKPIFTEALEMVAVTFKVVLMAGFVVALPVVLHQAIRFVSPGLTSQEKAYLYAFLPGTLAAFVAGVAFGYYVLFPPAFHFLFTFGADNVEPAIRVSSYINVLTSLMFWMGMVFELPLIMFGLGRLGVVTPDQMSRFRKYAVILAFVAGAFITPTFDPINQCLVAVPILVLYEVGILLARVGRRMRGNDLRQHRPVFFKRWTSSLQMWLASRLSFLDTWRDTLVSLLERLRDKLKR